MVVEIRASFLGSFFLPPEGEGLVVEIGTSFLSSLVPKGAWFFYPFNRYGLAFLAFLRELQKRIERHFLHGCMKNNYLKHKGEMWDSHPARRPSPASLTLYPSPLTCTSHPPPFNPHLPHPAFHLPPLTLTKVIADHQANNGVCSSRGGRLRRSGPPSSSKFCSVSIRTSRFAARRTKQMRCL